ncbi:unnamed protein product [Urochloa decumbens]|uniref:Pentatricopeptide repeat-containing protein n=1 Tax=Urochloa decumbens TaxID=240449 RepID=A0ABC8ZTQ3_9POAL
MALFSRLRASSPPHAAADPFVLSPFLKACASAADAAGILLHAAALHAFAVRSSASSSVFVSTALADAYAKAGRLEAALKEGFAEEAFALFSEMRHHSSCPRPNEFTLASLLSVCASAATLDAGRQLHTLAVVAGLEHHAMVRSALIDMYGKSGSMSDADVVFCNRTRYDVISWTAMIVGHAEHGHSKEALRLFEEMCHAGLKPDHVTFIGVLAACSHAGEVELGLRYLDAMSKRYGVELAKEHYGCVVDLLGRAGRIHEAEELIGRIAADERDGVVWTSLLRACAARGADETGKKAAERVMEAEPWGSGAHVAMANLYASKGQWREAAQERHLMKRKGVVKGAGWSSVEVGGEDRGVGVFVSGDRTNPKDNAIYVMLDLIYYGAGMVQHIPDQLDLGSKVELTIN